MANVLPQNIVPQNIFPAYSASVTSCSSTDNFVRVKVRISVKVAGTNFAKKNVVGHDVLAKDAIECGTKFLCYQI